MDYGLSDVLFVTEEMWDLADSLFKPLPQSRIVLQAITDKPDDDDESLFD